MASYRIPGFYSIRDEINYILFSYSENKRNRKLWKYDLLRIFGLGLGIVKCLLIIKITVF